MLAALLALLGTRPAFAVDERPLAEPRHPPLTCYAGYLKREAPHGLEGVRAAIRQALARKDTAALGFLEERLAEVIGQDASAALRVVEWAGTAREPEMSLYLRAVRETDAVRAPAVVERLTAMAETHADPGHQTARPRRQPPQRPSPHRLYTGYMRCGTPATSSTAIGWVMLQ